MRRVAAAVVALLACAGITVSAQHVAGAASTRPRLTPVVVTPERQGATDRPYRMHGVDMREKQDSRSLAGTGVAHHEHVAQSGAPRDSLDGNRKIRHVGLDDVDHSVDRRGVARGAFGANPPPDTLDHGAKVDPICLRHGRA